MLSTIGAGYINAVKFYHHGKTCKGRWKIKREDSSKFMLSTILATSENNVKMEKGQESLSECSEVPHSY